MNKGIFVIVWGAALLIGGAACERVSFPEEETEDGTGHGGSSGGGSTAVPQDSVVLDGTGEGTVNRPSRVADIQREYDAYEGRSCWVVGYIVGYTERAMKNAVFSAEGAVKSNILLADLPWETDPEACMPVELKTEKWRKELSLALGPEKWGRYVLLHGMILDYFSVPGIRQLSDVRWVEEPPLPEEPEEPDAPELPEEPDASDPSEKPENPEKPETSEEPDASDPSEKPETPEEPDVPEKPDASDPSQKPEKPEKPDLPEKPENPGKPEEPVVPDGPAFYLDGCPVYRVNRLSDLVAGRAYMLGAVRKERILWVASIAGNGLTRKYRTAVSAFPNGDGWQLSPDGGQPVSFILERTERGFRFRDRETGGYLAYDCRGDASATTWMPLYTVDQGVLNERYKADFKVDPEDEWLGVQTAYEIRYSEVYSRPYMLRYNVGGSNFKLGDKRNGYPVSLYFYP